MVVKVVDKNKEKIEEILATVNGRARRRILNYERLLDVVKTAKDRLEGVLGSKCALYGAKVFYVPNEVFPRNYFYEPEGTCVKFHFDKRGNAVLTYASRIRISKYTWIQYDVEYTDKQLTLMHRRASRF